MRTILIILGILICASPAFGASCSEKIPAEVSSDIMICEGNYSFQGISVTQDESVIDCNNAHLRCDNQMLHGISMEGHKDVGIENCRISGCQNAIYAQESNVTVYNCSLHNNINGIAVERSYLRAIQNTITNNDQSIHAIGGTLNLQDNDLAQEPTISKLTPGTESDEDSRNRTRQNETGTDDTEETANNSAQPQPNTTKSENDTRKDNSTPETVTVKLRREAMQELLNEIIQTHAPNISSQDRNEIADEILREYDEHFQGELQIQRSFTQKGNRTNVDISLNYTASTTRNASIYESIPKCAAEFSHKVLYERKPQVLKEDPLTVWHISDISEEALSYSIKGELTTHCKEMFRTLVIPRNERLSERISDYKEQRKQKENTFILMLSALAGVFLALVFVRAWYRSHKI